MNLHTLSLLAFSGIFDDRSGFSHNEKSPVSINNLNMKPVVAPIPKGCKRFYYNQEGLCSKSDCLVYFDAMKPSTAHAKYKKWLSK